MQANESFRRTGGPTASSGGEYLLRDAWRRVTIVTVAVLLLGGCLSVPVAETDAMAKATDAVASASDVLIGQLNVAEKNILLQRAKATTDPTKFVVADAPLYSTLDTYAPDTAKFRAGIDILKNYAGLIKSLVEGKDAAVAREQINSIVGDLNFLLNAAPEFKAVFNAFSPLIDKALVARSRAEARDLVAKGKPAVTALIGALKNSTPAMFRLLLAGSAAEGPKASFDSDKTRVQLSNYAVLLDRLQETFDRLADAFANPSSAASLANLAQATGELVATAKIVQQGLAALR